MSVKRLIEVAGSEEDCRQCYHDNWIRCPLHSAVAAIKAMRPVGFGCPACGYMTEDWGSIRLPQAQADHDDRTPCDLPVLALVESDL